MLKHNKITLLLCIYNAYILTRKITEIMIMILLDYIAHELYLWTENMHRIDR